jgi:hypothetical protein
LPTGGSGHRREGTPGGADDPWVREPDGDGEWDADGFDGAGSWAEEDGSGRPRTGRPRTGRSTHEFRPGLEALRLAIHQPEDVADCLEAALFRDDLQRAAFEVLAGAGDEPLHDVIEQARPEVRSLLVRLTVEEPRSQPDEVVLQLVRDAARGELVVITGEARTSSEAAAEAAQVASWVQELDDPSASAAATAGLVAWLVVRAQSSSPGSGS